MDDSTPQPPAPLDYRSPDPPLATAAPVATPRADWWVLAIGHGLLAVVGGALTLTAVIGGTSAGGDIGPMLVCGGLPALIGVPCLAAGVRGLNWIRTGRDPTR